MEQYCLNLYLKMTADLEKCDAFRDLTLHWIECCFKVCELASIRLSKESKSFNLECRRNQIEFRKVWRPKFTSHVEYFKFLYKSEMFAPQAQLDSMEYWKQEMTTAEHFIHHHIEFFNYCNSDDTVRDEEFFVLSNEDETCYSYLLSKLMAKEKLIVYCVEKLRALKGVKNI